MNVSGVTTIILNSVVLTNVGKRGSSSSRLTAAEVYIVNMALCDFFRAAIGFPLVLLVFFKGGWKLNTGQQAAS